MLSSKHMRLSCEINPYLLTLKCCNPACTGLPMTSGDKLRSASSNQLDVPSFRLPTVGSRVFPIAGAKVWNSLPDDVTSAPSLSAFRHHLKTHLFRCCYNTWTLSDSAVLSLTIVVLVVALLLRPL